MSTKFYAGQLDYIYQLNLMDDSYVTAMASVSGKANKAGDTFTGQIAFPSAQITASASVAWGVTNGTSTSGLNVVMGTGASATWLVSGTSGGVFRSGIQSLDADGTLRFFQGASFFSFAGGTLTATTFSGALSGNATTATTATNATNVNTAVDNATNATMYPLWVTAAGGGNLPVKISATKLTFNPSTGALTSTSFVGALTGNASSASGVATTDDTATNATYYPTFVTANTGNLPVKVSSTKLTYNPSTGSLTATNVYGTTIATANGADNQILIGGDPNGAIEIGKTGRVSAGTPYIDWHSSAASPDHDVRMQVSGGSATAGQGTLTVTAAAVSMTGTLSTTGNVTVGGNLTVNGTTTTTNSTTVTIDDPIFTLGGDTAPVVDDNKDRGIEFRWHNGTVAKTGFFGFDDSTGFFTFIPDGTNTGEVYAGTVGTIQANLSGNVTGNLTGAVTGNASTATALQTTRAINGVNFDGTAAITVKASTTNTIAFNNGGAGSASGTTFDGGTAGITVSYNTIGAAGTAADNTLTGNNTFSGTFTASGTSASLGTNTGASTVNVGSGATVNAATKTINIGTGGVAGSVTNVNFGNAAGTVTYTFNGTSGVKLPTGTIANRPTGSQGLIRFNTDTVQFEGHNGTTWTSVGGGAKGGGSDQVFYENDQTVTASYTITTGKNAVTVGPLTVSGAAAVTVPTGSRLVIL
jgi:hypothetical protein